MPGPDGIDVRFDQVAVESAVRRKIDQAIEEALAELEAEGRVSVSAEEKAVESPEEEEVASERPETDQEETVSETSEAGVGGEPRSPETFPGERLDITVSEGAGGTPIFEVDTPEGSDVSEEAVQDVLKIVRKDLMEADVQEGSKVGHAQIIPPSTIDEIVLDTDDVQKTITPGKDEEEEEEEEIEEEEEEDEPIAFTEEEIELGIDVVQENDLTKNDAMTWQSLMLDEGFSRDEVWELWEMLRDADIINGGVPEEGDIEMPEPEAGGDLTERVAESDAVWMVTTTGCPGCMQAKDLLSDFIEEGLIEVKNIQEDDEGLDAVMEEELASLPQLVLVEGDEYHVI